MRGLITGKDVLRHGFTILRCYGPACYFRCIRAVVSGQRCTFLSIAVAPEHGHSH
jgi:hypothetical protein